MKKLEKKQWKQKSRGFECNPKGKEKKEATRKCKLQERTVQKIKKGKHQGKVETEKTEENSLTKFLRTDAVHRTLM